MADSIGEVKFGVGADFSDVFAQFAQLHKELDTLTESVAEQSNTSAKKFTEWGKSVSESGKKIGDSLFSTGKQVTLLAAPLTGIGVLAAKTAIEFESSFAGVRKTIDATDAEFGILETSFRELSKQIPVSVNELNKIGEIGGQLGIAKGDVLEFTKTIAAMGATTNLSAEGAANAFARIGVIMGITSDGFSRLGSTIVDLGNKGASTESEIVNMGLRIAGAASAAKITTEGMLGLSAALANVGIRAEAGGTSMSKLIIKIAGAVASGGEDLEQFASVAGVSADKFSQAFRDDGANAIGLFVQGLGNIQKSGGNLFGVLDELGFKEIRLRDTLLRSASASEQFTATLVTSRAAWAENSALTAEAEKRYVTAASQLTVFNNKLSDVRLTLGQALIPMLTQLLSALDPMINLLASAARGFTSLDPTVQKVIVGIVAVTAVVGPMLIIIGKMVAAVSALIPVVTAIFSALSGLPAILTAVVVGFRALGVLLLANPWIAIATGIATAAIAIIANWDKIKAGTEAAWTAMKTLVVGTAKAIYEGIVEWLITKASAVAAKLQTIASSFAKPFEWLAQHLVGRSVIPDMVDDIQHHMENLDVAMTAPARNATVNTGRVFEGLALTTKTAMDQIVSTINFGYGSAVQSVSGALARMTTETVNWAQVGMQIGQQFLSSMINVAIQLLTQWILTTTGIAAAFTTMEATKTAVAGAGEGARLAMAMASNKAIAASTIASLGGMAAIGQGAVMIMVATTTAAAAMMSSIAAALTAGVITSPLAVPVAAAAGTLGAGGLAAGAAATGAIQAALGAAIGVASAGLAFQTGGIGDFGSGTPATLHGKEAIIPLNDRGAGFMRDLMGMGQNTADQPISQTIIFQLDKRTIATVVAENLPASLRLQGVSL